VPAVASYEFWSPNHQMLAEIGYNSLSQVNPRPVREYIYLGGQRVTKKTRTWDESTGVFTEKNVYYLQGNHLGATVQATDSSRTVVMRADYTPFGDKVLSGVGFDVGGLTFGPGLPGQYQEGTTTGFTNPIHNGRRYLLADKGMYLQPEPVLSVPGIVLAYGVSGVPLNAYAYAAGNPVKFVDPSGLEPIGWDWREARRGAPPIQPTTDPTMRKFEIGLGISLLALAALPVVIFTIEYFWPAAFAAAPTVAAAPDCRQLSEAFIRATGQGQLVTLVPQAGQTLQALPGVFANPVALHQAVLLESGVVVDPLLGTSFPSIQIFLQTVVGPAGAATQVMVNGQVINL